METQHRHDLGSSTVLLGIVYFVAAKIGLVFASVHANSTAVWPCSGIAIGFLLVRGFGVWPGILFGAFAAHLTTEGSFSTSAAIAFGCTLEAMVGAWLVEKYADGAAAMDRVTNALRFFLLAGVLCATISATIGVVSLSLGGFAEWNAFGPIWLTWWVGGFSGVALVAPLLLLSASSPPVKWPPRQVIEAGVLAACLVAVGLVVFNALPMSGIRHYPMEYASLPFLIWAAFRFGRRGAAVATLILGATAIWGALHDRGPFAGGSRNESLVLLQAFMAVGAFMAMALAAEVTQRRRAEREARSLAVSDPLTGLGNYRRFIDALESEIKRSERTDRTFILLLMDFNGLKQINDIHGHLMGDRALRRFANVLRYHCRNIDTAARYAGDEFALILPETGWEAGTLVAQRIAERLAADGEQPPASVSVGVALWPRDGTTAETLLRAADDALYAMKRRIKSEQRVADPTLVAST